MALRRIDIAGQRFGKLLVLRPSHHANRQLFWECQCACGRIHVVPSSRLRRGDTSSCGHCSVVSDTAKRCTGCGEVKPLVEFHKSTHGELGRASRCNSCRAQAARASYLENRKEVVKQCREYRERKAEEIRSKSRARNRDRAAEFREYMRRLREEHPEIVRAHDAVAKALKSGALKKPAACSACRRSDVPRLVGHHYRGYSPEHWLDVEWLCDRCHARHHAEREAS